LTAETNIDDMNPEFYGLTMERLFAAGALDAFIVPVIMKKGRPGVILKTIFHEDKKDSIVKIIFRETTTAGIRISRSERVLLNRRHTAAETEFGSINIKVLEDSEGTVMTASPEYEDCREAAQRCDVPVGMVYDAAKRAAEYARTRAAGVRQSQAVQSHAENSRGMVHVYTGSGKGKTTAALGLAVRAAGQGLKCGVIRFMKGRDSGELHTFRQIPGINFVRSYGLSEFYIEKDRESFEKHSAEASTAYADAVKSCSAGNIDLLVLDEIITACYMGLVTVEMVISLVENRDEKLELVLTGTGASDKIISAADLVTEMKPLKHYYDSGVQARRGIEF
jgi:cob(I)alamin adenosyltransferase